MIYFKYTIYTIANLIFTALAYILAPVLGLFVQDNGWLPNWLKWFQTFDASCDAGWQDGYYVNHDGSSVTNPSRFKRYTLRVRWLWRNPAYGFCYYVLGIPFNKDDWTVEYNGKVFTAKSKDGHFNLETSGGVKLGWKVWNMIDHFDENFQPVWKTQPWGPEWRIPVCFTP